MISTHRRSLIFGVAFTFGSLTAHRGWRCDLLSFCTNVRLLALCAISGLVYALTVESRVLCGHVLLHGSQSPVGPFRILSLFLALKAR